VDINDLKRGFTELSDILGKDFLLPYDIRSLMNVIRIIYRIANKITKSKEKQKQPQLDKSSNTEYIVEKIYCRFCGKVNSSMQEFCTMCGMRLHIPPSTIMKACTKCGLAMNDDSIFCAGCGTKFEEDV
jgi:RNA polymerase subunit RPABC4/transcription elongation factor Spt4